ncbi:MAG: hypothetical protein K2X35_01490 [Bryobacteraceae bacterium]|nr:hypothetical protein [Bryobacteraceae bacterium]
MGDRLRYFRIAIATALMASFIFVLGETVVESQRPAVVAAAVSQPVPELPLESGVFRDPSDAREYRWEPDARNANRSLASFYQRRAYDGAPPPVPHKLLDPGSFGGGGCLSCHAEGGYVRQFKAWTPVTPHPDFLNCLQCHVGEQSQGEFRGNVFQTVRPPETRQAPLPGSPPPVPHGLQMRDNCRACHGGPGAVGEIRSTHPQRVNCRQCHAAVAAPGASGGEFTRPVPGGQP